MALSLRALVSAAILVFAVPLSAQQLQLLKDINSQPKTDDSSYPDRFVQVGSKAFFRAQPSYCGAELFVYDGSRTQLVLDIYPGKVASDLERLVAFAGECWFLANDGAARPRALAQRRNGGGHETRLRALPWQDERQDRRPRGRERLALGSGRLSAPRRRRQRRRDEGDPGHVTPPALPACRHAPDRHAKGGLLPRNLQRHDPRALVQRRHARGHAPRPRTGICHQPLEHDTLRGAR